MTIEYLISIMKMVNFIIWKQNYKTNKKGYHTVVNYLKQ